MLGTYGAAALIFAASTIVGMAVFRLAGWVGAQWTAPAVGLATLVAITAPVIRLPGRATTASVVVVIVVVLCAVLIRPRGWRVDGWVAAGVVTVASVVAASIPFLASRRVGLLGVGFDDDMATHLVWAEALRSASFARHYPVPASYPLGPHSLAAMVSALFGIRLDHAFQGLLLAIVPMTALAASGAMRAQSLLRRLPVALIASVAYLVSAYYGESAFKETMMALFLLAFVLIVRDLAHGDAPRADGRATPLLWVRAGIPLGLLVAGSVQAYTYAALAWLGGFVVAWVALELLARPSLVLHRSRRRGLLLGPGTLAGAAIGVAIIVLLPEASRVVAYFHGAGLNPAGVPGGGLSVSTLGNLPGPLSTFEGLGLWHQADWRFPPTNMFLNGEWAALALGVLIFGLWHAVRQRDFTMPAAIAAIAAIYFYAQHTQSPYVAAKALIVGAPVVMVCGGRALFAGDERSFPAGLGRLVVGLVFAALALYSSLLVLRQSTVWDNNRIVQLDQIRRFVGGRTVLFVGGDDRYAPWELRGTALGAHAGTVTPAIPVDTNPQKVWAPGTPMDFDSFTAAQLNQFRFYVTSNGRYASQPPLGIRPVRAWHDLELWERTGPIVPRQVLEPLSAPGAVLDCTKPPGSLLSRQSGVASVWAVPPIAVAESTVFAGIATLVPESHSEFVLAVPRGLWDLSVNYQSGEQLLVSVMGHRTATLPSMTEEQGQYYDAGRFYSPGGPVTISIFEAHPSRFTSPNGLIPAHIDGIAATMAPETHTMVPLRQACGRYVDWFQTSSAPPRRSNARH